LDLHLEQSFTAQCPHAVADGNYSAIGLGEDARVLLDGVTYTVSVVRTVIH